MKTELIRTISLYDTIILHRHVRPDPDAYGSQCGLTEILRETYPEKNIFAVGTPEPSLSFLYSLDEVDNETYEAHLSLSAIRQIRKESTISVILQAPN